MALVEVSITGVPTMPTVGEISPQGNSLDGTGTPALFSQITLPLEASSAYSRSPTVATYTREPSTSGCPQIGAPSGGDCHAKLGASGVPASGSSPERAGSRWYVGHIASPWADGLSAAASVHASSAHSGTVATAASVAIPVRKRASMRILRIA